MKKLLMMIGAAAALGMMPAMADTSKIAYWTGGGDRSNVNDPANWAITNSLGEAVADAVPDADTAIGDCKLTADCDWRGLAAFTNDYIDVPNGAYIDTGFKPNQDTRVVVDVTVRNTKEYWFGCWNSAYNDGAFAVCNDGGKLYSGYGNSGGGVAPVIGIGRHTVELDNGIVKVDGATHTDRSGQAAFQLNYNLYLFAQNRKGSTNIPGDQGTIRFHSCKIYDNGMLVRDYVPTNNGTAFGLYDKANGTFSASANDSAPFTGEIVAPEINGTVDLAGHSLLLASTAGSGTITDTSGYIDVPKGYYIDTGFKPNQDTRVVVDVTVRNTKEYWFGCWNSAYNNGAFAVCNDGGKLYSGYGNSGGGVEPVIGIGRHTVELDNGIVKVDGATHTDRSGQAAFQLNYNLYLFAQNRKGSTTIPNDQGAIRFHSCKIYDNGTLVRDYIPSNKGTEFGLYEKVSGAFNPLSGSGAESATGVVAGGELHIDINGGRIDGENTALTLAGSLTLVKDGAGMFTASKAGQSYTGGTVVSNGWFKSTVESTSCGMAESLITVAEGAGFDWAGPISTTSSMYSFDIVGTGPGGDGAILFSSDSGTYNSFCLKNLTLSGDALIVDAAASSANYHRGFIYGGPHTLTLNSYTLTIDAGSKFDFRGVTAVDVGKIVFMTSKTSSVGYRMSSFWGADNDLSLVTFDMGANCMLNIDNDKIHSVGTFIDRGVSTGSGDTGLSVLDRFQPITTNLLKSVVMGDATHLSPVLDLSALDAPFVLPAESPMLSAAEGAMVRIYVGERRTSGKSPLISWTTPPSGVSFAWPDGASARKGSLVVRADGLYVVKGLIISFL